MSEYNQKLFSGGWRTQLHTMRFRWAARELAVPPQSYSLFELGCFDCRSLDFMPRPSRYLGADASWEGGLMDAKQKFAGTDWMELVKAETADALAPYADQSFDFSLSMETLEHIPDAALHGYLAFMARVTRRRALFTVPVEVGPVFLAKYLAKRSMSSLRNGETESYSWREVVAASLGHAERVARYEHKGFDYRRLVAQLAEHFTLVKVEGIPFKPLPYISFQVGIVAEPKK